MTLHIDADTGELVGGFRVAEREMDRLTKEAKKVGEGGKAAASGLDATTRAARSAGAAAKSAGNDLSGLGNKIVNLKNLLVGGAVLKFAQELVDAGNTMRGFESALTAVTGSAGRAKQELAFVRAEANRIGVSFRDSVQAFTGLSAAAAGTSLQGQGVRDIFTAVAEKARVMGLSTEQVNGTFTALTQIMGKGKVTAEELRGQLAERIPDAIQIMARALKISTAELDKQMAAGTLLAEDVLPKFAAELRKTAAGGLEAAKASPAAEFERLKNAIFDAQAGLANNTGFLELLAAGARMLTSALGLLPDLIGQVKAGIELWSGVFDDAGDAMGEFDQDLMNSASMWGGLIMDALAFIGRALVELPANLKGVFIIAIGEAEKFAISAVAAFQQFGVGASQVWNSVQSTVSGVVGAVRILYAQMVDGVLEGTADLVARMSALASAIGAEDMAASLGGAVNSLRAAASVEETVRAQVDQTTAAYATRRHALELEALAIDQNAATARAAADSNIAAGLAEIDAQKAAAQATAENERAHWALGEAGQAAAAGQKAVAAASGDADKAASKLAQAERAALDMLDTLEGKLSEVAAAQAEHDKGMRALEARMLAWSAAGGDAATVAEAWQRGEDALRANLAKTNAELRQRNQLTSGNKDLSAQIKAQSDRLAGLSAEQVAYNQAVREANELKAEAIKLGISETEAQDGLIDRLKKLEELREGDIIQNLVDQFATENTFDKLIADMARVEKAIDQAIGEGATDKAARLRSALGGMKQAMVTGIVDTSQQALRSLQSMTDDGSRAFQAFQVAIDALAVVQAISAVLNQGQGDPYTAFARMAAMAAAVAQLGVSIGSFSGGFDDTAAERQEEQGTGSVLGDPEAKSESIANATEITAKATSELVGINRGMLSALIQLNNALGAAATQLARGAGDAEFSPLPQATQFSQMSMGTRLLGMPSLSQRLLGGSSRITDQGIVIFGGALNDLLEDIAVGAYQEVQSRSWRFGSLRTNTGLVDVTDELGAGFQLVIQSITDTVREGALALGLLPAEIDAALAAFRIEEIKISLKGLSAEEQQAELEAVFSKLFDGIAGAVVPFIGQFQQVGEGLGETLVRVATEVQVMANIFDQLGIAVDRSDPEKFAQLVDGIVQAAGGLEEAQAMWAGFFEAFYNEAEAAQLSVNSVTGARDDQLDKLGLKPMTKEEFKEAFLAILPTLTPEEIVDWLRAGELIAAVEDSLSGLWDDYYEAFYDETEQAQRRFDMASARSGKLLTDLGLDADTTKEEFRAAFEAALPNLSDDQIAQWLIAGAALNDTDEALEALGETAEQTRAQLGELTKAQEKQLQGVADYAEFMAQFGGAGGGASLAGSLARIRLEEEKNIETANRLAKAAGLAGASERDLAAIHRRAAEQIAAAIIKIREETEDLIEQLYKVPGAINSLDELNARITEMEASGQGAAAAYQEAEQAAADLYRTQLEGLKSLQAYLDSMLLGDLSALSPEEQLAEARRQLQETAALAAGGDANAIARLPQLADAFLRLSQGFNASGGDYGADFAWVRQLLGGIVQAGPTTTPGGGLGGGPGVSPELRELYEQRDQRLAEQEAQHRANLALDLANHLRELALAVDTPVLQLMASMGVNLTDLATDLGINLEEITGASVMALGDMADALGLRLGDLTTGLGLSLTDLGAGLLDLTEQLGIDFENLTGANVESLAALASTLGLSLTEITTAMGLNLTDLSAGVLELTESLGIDLENLTVASTQQLATLAESLGVDLSELAATVGVDLGSLSDAQSLLNQALADTIDDLPAAQRDQLRPLLEAITNATNEADANAAVGAAEDAINGLPLDIRNQLAPFFQGVLPAAAMDDLDYLSGIYGYARDTVQAIQDLADAIAIAGPGSGGSSQNSLPSYAVGSSFVPADGPAMIHRGEMILPRPVADFLRSSGVSFNSAPGPAEETMGQLLDEVRRLRADNSTLLAQLADTQQRSARESSDKLAGAIDRQTDTLTRSRTQ